MQASVIVPVLNDIAGLRACLQSLNAQNTPCRDFEIIVVDNGSVPPLRAEISTTAPLRVLRCERPGSYAARNVGAAAAKGRFLLFIDADCRADPCWVERAIVHLGQPGGAQSVLGGDVRFSAPASPSVVARYQMLTGFGQPENIAERGFCATANMAMRVEAFRCVGPFNETLLSAGDLEWCWRARRLGLTIVFAHDMVVRTAPRGNLRAAILQARRVAGGRRQLRRRDAEHAVPTTSLGAARRPWEAVRLILSSRDVSALQRLQLLSVAVLLRLVRSYETLRLQLGASAERR